MTDRTPTPTTLRPDAVCDGGDLDCGSGLLLIVARALAPLETGGTLELRSREPNVLDELPVWCEAQKHTILDVKMTSGPTCYTIRKGPGDGEAVAAAADGPRSVVIQRRGDAWSSTPPAEGPGHAIDSFLVGLAACLSDAARRSTMGRAHGIEDVDATLSVEPVETTETTEVVAPLAVLAELRVPVALSADDAREFAAQAVAGSKLARTLAQAPRVVVRSADD